MAMKQHLNTFLIIIIRAYCLLQSYPDTVSSSVAASVMDWI